MPLPLAAHDVWANGEAVPGWIKNQCCGTDHAHFYDESQVHETNAGLVVNGYPYSPIPWRKVLPSPDGHTWVFYSTDLKGQPGEPICTFHGLNGF